MDDIGPPLTTFGVGESIWKLRDMNKQEFRRRMEGYIALCMPGHTIVRLEYPNVILRDERSMEHVKRTR